MLLHPYFLYGLTAMAAPVLIHLLARRRTRRVLFPSLRLLQAAEKKRRALSRLRRPLSLLLRMLMIALVSLALAAPIVGPLPGWLPLPRTAAVVVVLDDSLSMMGTGGARTPFEAARDATGNILAALGPGDRAAVVRTSQPGPGEWLSASDARELLEGLQPTAYAAKLAPSLLEAGEMLRDATEPNRVAVIVTDMQAAAWREPPVDAEGLVGLDVWVVDVGEASPTNTSVDELRVASPATVVGRPVRLAAEVVGHSDEDEDGDAQSLVVQLELDGEPTSATERDLPPNGTAAAQFSLTPTDAGDMVARVGLGGGPHGLAVDDVRWLTVRVRPPVSVLVAAPADVAPYVQMVLDPFADPVKSGFRTRTTGPGGLTAALSENATDVVVLADCPALSADAVAALKGHAESGGGLLVLLGDGADTDFLGGTLLPEVTGGEGVTFGEMAEAPAEGSLALGEFDTSRQPLAPFATPRAGDLGGLRFRKARGMTLGPAASMLAEFSTGAPALVEWEAGAGRVLLFNISADGSWGEHLKHPAYVPLMHRLCSHIARPAGPHVTDVLVGERPALVDAEPVPTEVTLTPPRGAEETVTVEDGLLPEVKEPGAYRVEWSDHEVTFAANVDPRESDTSRTDARAVREALGPAAVTFVPPAVSAAETRGQLPGRADLSWPLLLCALVVFLAEALLSTTRREPSETRTGPEASHA